MGRRTGRALLAIAALSALLAVPAHGSERVLSHWTVTISGSVRHTWSLPSSEPCQATGSGSMSAHFASTHPERITIADNGFGPADITWHGFFHRLSVTVTALDNRTRNPPLAGQTCDTSAPVPDTRACGTRHLHTGLSIDATGSQRGRFTLTDAGSFTTPAFNVPKGIEVCEMDGFHSFAWLSDEPRSGSQDLPIPHYPTDAQLGSRNGRIVIAVSQARHFIRSALTVRKVRIVFTRVG